MHRKVEGQDLKNLRAGHESLQQGSDLLPLGRANVIQDIEKAKESYLPVRNTVASKMRDFQLAHLGYPSLAAAPRNIKNRVVAAAGQYFKTGTCHSYSANILPLHAAKLPGMKDERSIVALCNYPGRDHVWPEMIPKETREDGTPILHGKDVKDLKAEIDSNRDWKRKCDYYIQSLVNSGMNVGERGRRNAESVFHADFREQAGRALHKNVLKAIA